VYEFLFHDPAVTPTSPGLGVRTFPEIGQVTVRSHQALCVLRAGPPLGLKRYAAGEYGAYGHSDPASGAFLIEHDGRFIACGPGPVYRRDTALHNVVTIDGQGQIGDSTVWLPDFFPPEVLSPTPDVESDGLRASFFVDLTGTYLPHLGVERCTRAMFADPERIVLGVDALVCARARSLEWNTHSVSRSSSYRRRIHLCSSLMAEFDLSFSRRRVPCGRPGCQNSSLRIQTTERETTVVPLRSAPVKHNLSGAICSPSNPPTNRPGT